MTRRREFLSYAGASALGALLPMAGFGAERRRSGSTGPAPAPVPTSGPSGRVVVVGGGMSGASVAKYLRVWGGTGVEVTLVEREPRYQSCILSNLVLNGSVSLQTLQFDYARLAQAYGIKIVPGDVLGLDAVKRTIDVQGASGRASIAYDRLVLAPGVEFDTLPGLEDPAAQAQVPHAWKAGPQTTQLRDLIQAMQPGQVFLMTVPATPYRCPPGPYERACIVADYLKTRKPGAKVIVLDANPGIVAERANFTNAFENIHRGVIEYVPGVTIDRIEVATKTVKTSFGDFKADVINAIPPHRAGRIVTQTGLATVGGRWAGVDVLSYESAAAPGVHVIGDSCGTTQPKAGHIGNQEGKVCADAVTRLLGGIALDPAPVTNSACYSPITAATASWLTAVFAYDPATRTMKAVPASAGEARAPSKDNYEEMFVWFRTLMGDTFA
jgi:NADPH-dependent 2,4-dienoyl-CoA reductase/sulfur reductase-like enzyme